jgi:hypothetical protein
MDVFTEWESLKLAIMKRVIKYQKAEEIIAALICSQ